MGGGKGERRKRKNFWVGVFEGAPLSYTLVVNDNNGSRGMGGGKGERRKRKIFLGGGGVFFVN